MRQICIDEEGAGQWVMDRVEGAFSPSHDHSFTTHSEGKILGGFVLCQYLGGSICVHMAAEDKHWCSHDLLWLVFHYAFEQLGCYKVLAPLRSDNHRAIAMSTQAGWGIEAVINDAFAPGVHLLVLGMTKETCPWLDHPPASWDSINVRAA